ncbi:MAG: hypothetical protein EOO07_27775 [Chitinophagaceae bacterium]|nr:MAG: hypothetical protein EOO07_27775 [Chitinophagaceae bacterium]
MDQLLLSFKLKLQSLGALRPEAWNRIVELSQQFQISTTNNLIRKNSSLVYVADGLLKEYDQHERELPAIVNFISQYQCFITRKHHQHRYLETCMPCVVYQWSFDDLQNLYQHFNELKPVYEMLCAEYEDGVMLRMRLLEMSVKERIETFKCEFKAVLPFLKKKDIANYLHLHYTHFLRHWNS